VTGSRLSGGVRATLLHAGAGALGRSPGAIFSELSPEIGDPVGVV
jgi:hypothetical protein